jgi:hypothetical protein
LEYKEMVEMTGVVAVVGEEVEVERQLGLVVVAVRNAHDYCFDCGDR